MIKAVKVKMAECYNVAASNEKTAYGMCKQEIQTYLANIPCIIGESAMKNLTNFGQMHKLVWIL